MTGQEAMRNFLSALRRDWEDQLKPERRVVLQLAVRSDEARRIIISCLEDTRHDDVLIGMPYPSSSPHPPAALELIATDHPPIGPAERTAE